MANIRQTALTYEPKTTKNIADLEKVSTMLDIREEEYTKEDGETFKIQVITVDDTDYRVPTCVLAQLKVLLEDNPEMEFFKVKKTGAGLQTAYTVIPIRK